jgi:HPt (histidine-containing phosphotransfer) domain-containing protein
MTDTSQEPWTDQSLLDEEATLERLKGDAEFLTTLYGVFIDDLPKKLTAIKEAAEKGDMNELQRGAHALKGASATVGASALREAAFSLEVAAKEDNALLTEAIIPKLEELALKTRDKIREST